MSKENLREECIDKDALSCGCGHCHEKTETTVYDKTKSGFSNFISEYGFDFLKIFLSVILWCLGKFLPVSPIATLILYISSALVVGYMVLLDFFKNIFHGEFLDENTLMFIAGVAAFVLGEYSEGAMIIILFILGELLEDIATGSSRRKIAGLSELKTETAHLIGNDGTVDVSPEKVEVGSLLLIKRGDRIPIDGILIDKSATLDMKTITGESKYFEAKIGDKVFSGSINVGEAIVIRTEKLYVDSTAQRIVDLVESSSVKKAKSQKFITAFAKYYTPIIVGLGMLVAVIPPLFDGYNFVKWIYKALSFIVISCPCALVISVPLGYFVGIGSLAKKGVLVKGSSYLETLAGVKTVAFDKTGTLTKGNFAVESFESFNGFDKETVLNYSAALESFSSHPVAKAICAYVGVVNGISVKDIKEISGKGISGVVDGKEVIIGNYTLMVEKNIEAQKNDFSGTLLYLAVDNSLAGEFLICDQIKENAAVAIESIKRLGINDIAVLSGDNKKIVNDTAERLGIKYAYGELLPEDKVRVMEKLKKKTSGKLFYSGDGINDAPVLSVADVGVSMGGLGSELAIETSDIVIMDDDLSKIPLSVRHAKKVKRTVLQNIVGSIAIKTVIMILSVVINLPIWLALFADVGVMLLAVLNSLRNFNVKKI